MAAFSEGKGAPKGEWKTGAEKNQARGALEFGKEEGKYRLECRSNVVVGICFCSVRDVGGEEVLSSFPRRKGKEKGKGVFPDAVRMETGVLGEALWVQVGERDLTSRKCSLATACRMFW
ncbi:hypothetical protein CK203_096417 [Vitis vinifera]|uniref:Uncharacterized protein n=1 Tax=Vitis vinifera TaxID=29760 RepID=A0A438BX12_VITVI|nr:hypothetical protein CK203_096417 [Vitis vinifera]